MSVTPFVKWAGGKRQMLSLLINLMPKEFNTYYEPFVGGGALFFSVNAKKKVIGDINKILISTYLTVRDNLPDFLSELEKIYKEFNDSSDKGLFYAEVRNDFNKAKRNSCLNTRNNAEFVFLNKACYNGLYRENSNGEFNVPFNKNTNLKTFDIFRIEENSRHLQGTEIICGDFQAVCKSAKKNDFIFFDSPYDVINQNTFKMYVKSGFSIDDHVRLANLFKEKSDLGCYCMLTNHDTPLIRELYKNYKIQEINVRRSINRNHNQRIGKELIITNY